MSSNNNEHTHIMSSENITQGAFDNEPIASIDYEYANPTTYTGGSTSIQATSPFGVDSEVAVTYYSCNDAAGVTMVSYIAPITAQTLANPPGELIGNMFRGAVPGVSMAPFFSPVMDMVNIVTSMPTGNFVLTLQFRRRAIMYVPHEETYYGDTNA